MKKYIININPPAIGNVTRGIYKEQIPQDTFGTPIAEQYITELGTYVPDQVTFGNSINPTKWKDRNGIEHVVEAMTFQAILISVSFPRNIVKTEIQGRNGTVKEYIGEGDAQISFKGIITGKNGEYPVDAVQKLKELSFAPIPVEVTSKYLQSLGIDTIVFEDRSFEQQEGGWSYQTFVLNAISDTPQELTYV